MPRGVRWHGEDIARTLLGQEAGRQYEFGLLDIAAHLYYDRAHARGVSSRRAFSRSIRASGLPPETVRELLQRLDRQVEEFERLADAVGRAARVKARDGRSPIERAIDEVTGNRADRDIG